jgi:hypothetical protein
MISRTLAWLLVGTAAAAAQEAGWTYSPYPGEGDRAAMGCASGSTPELHACVAVRCEDDRSVAVYIKTSRPQGDVTDWVMQVDDAAPALATEPAAGLPYGARVRATGTSIATLVEALKQGSVAFLEPVGGDGPVVGAIPMSGSLYAINQALYYCAPEAGAEAPAAE